ncbi:MAG: plasmid pRiA4b ORF-3 family protein [Verrucomicrobia bacterium]|nr:plasmid pRiA4b ORF-3 family protein [Verrucomicrobiota bacterium]
MDTNKQNPDLIYQFKITLTAITPLIWRRIQVPAMYSFWELHVAIQDAMGWLDCHLHTFRIPEEHENRFIEIGSPSDVFDDETIIPEHKTPLAQYVTDPGQVIKYEYDFGDGWLHEVLLEEALPKTKGARFPKCIDGERACPPEDCGGPPGYYELLETLQNPEHEEYEDSVDWLKNHLKNYHPFNPDEFSPSKVRFDNPKQRWKISHPGT